MNENTQHDRVLRLLDAAEAVCSTTFLALYIPRAGARIWDLRQEGYVIETRPCRQHAHRTRQIEYRLLAQPEPAAREAVLMEAGLRILATWTLPSDSRYGIAPATRLAAYQAKEAWDKVVADTSPAAAALLAHVEELETEREEHRQYAQNYKVLAEKAEQHRDEAFRWAIAGVRVAERRAEGAEASAERRGEALERYAQGHRTPEIARAALVV